MATPSEHLPNVKGSTAQILIALYKTTMGFQNVSDDDPMLRRAVAIDAKTTQAKNLLAQTGRIAEQQSTLEVHIARIEAAANVRGSQQSSIMGEASQMYRQQSAALMQRYQALQSQRETMMKHYRKIVSEQREALSDLIQKKPQSISITDIERVLKTFERDVKLLVKEKSSLSSDYSRVLKETGKLVESTRSAQFGTDFRPERPT